MYLNQHKTKIYKTKTYKNKIKYTHTTTTKKRVVGGGRVRVSINYYNINMT